MELEENKDVEATGDFKMSRLQEISRRAWRAFRRETGKNSYAILEMGENPDSAPLVIDVLSRFSFPSISGLERSVEIGAREEGRVLLPWVCWVERMNGWMDQ